MSKYKNKRVEFLGKTFASQKEALRYAYLVEQQKRGEIKNLECQVKYIVIDKTDKFREVSYIADFVYSVGDETVVEDVKPDNMKWFKTTGAYAEFNIKQKLMYSRYGIEVQIL